ncbi:hypothetical protein D3C81_1707260 [compost metagenome]
MQAVDHAYSESQRLLVVSGDELRNAQQVVGFQKTEIAGLRNQLEERDSTIGKMRKDYGRDRQDLLEAEKFSDELDEKLRDAQSVIGKQEQLIAGQRKAIADMHNELAHRRVIGKAFMQARLAFVALDEALHEAPQSKAVRAVGDDKECAGQPAGEGV